VYVKPALFIKLLDVFDDVRQRGDVVGAEHVAGNSHSQNC
jgi:hypothetical protein